MRLIVAVLACMIAVPTIAEACQCDSSASLAIGPAPGTRLPQTPTIYVFAPNALHDGTPFVHDIYVTNTATSRPNTTIRTRQIAIDPEYMVFEIESDASEGVLELHLTYGTPEVFRFPLSDNPPENRVRPLEMVVQEMTDCGMSNEKAVTLTLQGNAAAYALEWDDGRKTVLPAIDNWNSPTHDIRIGTRCSLTNVPFDRLHEEHRVTLRALFPNGTSRIVATTTLQLSPTHVRTPIEILDARGGGTADFPSTAPRDIVIQATANPTGSSIAGGAATGGAVVIGGALVRARRRRHQNRL